MNTVHKKNEGTQKSFCVGEIVGAASKVVFYIGSALLLIIMFMVTIDVLGRVLFNKPLWGVLEISEFLLAGAVLLGLGYTEFSGGNVMVELIYDKLSPKVQNIMRIFYSIVGIGLFSAITWASGVLTIGLMKANLTSDVLKIPAWPFRAFVPIGAFLVVLVLIVKLFRNIQELRSGRANQCR